MNFVSHALTLFALSTLLFFISCGKKNDCVAGTGGNVTIVAFPQHHGKPIYNYAKPGYPDSAFVKFSPPSNFTITANPADYDLVLTGQAGDNFVNLPNLKCGDYFIYMTGWDSSLYKRVTGGIPFSFSQTDGSDSVNVPVTE